MLKLKKDFPIGIPRRNIVERHKTMSKAIKKSPRTDKTRQKKDAKVRKSSHGKYSSVIALEEHRRKVTKAKKG